MREDILMTTETKKTTALGLVTRRVIAIDASSSVSRMGAVVHQNCHLR